jgi:hypothetical protein
MELISQNADGFQDLFSRLPDPHGTVIPEIMLDYLSAWGQKTLVPFNVGNPLPRIPTNLPVAGLRPKCSVAS